MTRRLEPDHLRLRDENFGDFLVQALMDLRQRTALLTVASGMTALTRLIDLTHEIEPRVADGEDFLDILHAYRGRIRHLAGKGGTPADFHEVQEARRDLERARELADSLVMRRMSGQQG